MKRQDVEAGSGTLLANRAGIDFECGAVLDVLVVRGLKNEGDVADGKAHLERIAAMLIALLKSLGGKARE